MKKKTPKKLALHRETLRQLAEETLTGAVGGTIFLCTGTNCNISICLCD